MAGVLLAAVLGTLPCFGGWILDGRRITAGGGTPGAMVAIQGTYPVFRLDLGLVDGNWTDFEIKASTNNFASMVYYYKSWTPTQEAAWSDPDSLTYFTDDYSADVRAWRCQTEGVPISAHLVDLKSVVQWVYFYPSHECAVDWRAWMSATNSSLVWSFVRVDDVGFEMNADGTKQRWNPIRPDSWDAERTVP
jgi:hypothetical protein